ncbi:peptidoglycan DD-metalloendopeptidase family protein [Colwellia sp. Bg11-28]|uniref:peptidoglycan DD-metalloendopeptidase family protein n=1 Tax=Colwellia sp. Bg11-28 TaxID=2058305 RepID=UPI000C32B79F|nr:peptidoglycan DD-metalloendopeptidase family protein [Colwellia sp. Bg11-28]PKH89259.1 peptidase M23 [Colwellia sp. Bg11-28]
MKGLWFLLLLAGCFTLCQAGQMYKYKDANGNWVFSDKPPVIEQDFSTVQFISPKKPSYKVQLYNVKNKQGYTLYAKNDFYAPIEVGFTSPISQTLISKVIPARGRIALLESKNKILSLDHRWALGAPNSVAENYQYHAPFSSPKGHRITQGFNGKFSHTNDYNKYAVDIAMDVGTYLTAVRAGTVVWVKDDYHMSGTTNYFLDKANVIKILHDDGTFSSYAHILMDTALVKEGDKVALGDKLARSGSSGFSTGPHLHFSIIKNAGLKNIAIPFKFVDNKGTAFTPKRAMIMVGASKP